MIEHLLQLERKLTEWIRSPTEDQRDEIRLVEIAGLAEKTAKDLLLGLERCKTRDILALRFNDYHHKVVGLINRHPWITPIREALDGLEDRLTDGKLHLLDEDRDLPRHERERLQALVDRDLPVICLAIERHNLPASYCHEIRCAFRNLFDDARLPALAYRHKAYVPPLLNQGLTLATDKASTRWNLRLLELFVNHNLNYMGIFERWKDRREAEFAEADKKGELGACLRRWERTVSHYNPKPGVVFDPHNESLHGHMRVYLRERRERFEYSQRLLDHKKSVLQLLTKLLIGDLAVRFRYFFLAGDFDYGTQQEAAEVFCEVYAGKGGKRLTAHSLTKFDKEALYGPARKFYRLLGRMRRMIEEEFKFKPTDID